MHEREWNFLKRRASKQLLLSKHWVSTLVLLTLSGTNVVTLTMCWKLTRLQGSLGLRLRNMSRRLGGWRECGEGSQGVYVCLLHSLKEGLFSPTIRHIPSAHKAQGWCDRG